MWSREKTSISLVFTFDSGDGVLPSVLGLVLRGLPLRAVLHRVLVHAGVPGQQAHVVFLTVVADGSPVTERLLEREAEKELFVFVTPALQGRGSGRLAKV